MFSEFIGQQSCSIETILCISLKLSTVPEKDCNSVIYICAFVLELVCFSKL